YRTWPESRSRIASAASPAASSSSTSRRNGRSSFSRAPRRWSKPTTVTSSGRCARSRPGRSAGRRSPTSPRWLRLLPCGTERCKPPPFPGSVVLKDFLLFRARGGSGRIGRERQAERSPRLVGIDREEIEAAQPVRRGGLVVLAADAHHHAAAASAREVGAADHPRRRRALLRREAESLDAPGDAPGRLLVAAHGKTIFLHKPDLCHVPLYRKTPAGEGGGDDIAIPAGSAGASSTRFSSGPSSPPSSASSKASCCSP